MTRQAVALAVQSAQRERAAMFEAAGAVREALFGNVGEGRRDATAADVEISARPYLVQGSGPAVYVIDAPPPVVACT